MEVKTIICDRCGKDITVERRFLLFYKKFMNRGQIMRWDDDKLDLCFSCRDAFFNWLKAPGSINDLG